jgi:hypothetical protein
MDISHIPLLARDSWSKARTITAVKIHDLAEPDGHCTNRMQRIEYTRMAGPAKQSHHCIVCSLSVAVQAHLWNHLRSTRPPTARTTPGNRTVARLPRAVIRRNDNSRHNCSDITHHEDEDWVTDTGGACLIDLIKRCMDIDPPSTLQSESLGGLAAVKRSIASGSKLRRNRNRSCSDQSIRQHPPPRAPLAKIRPRPNGSCSWRISYAKATSP